MTEMYTFHFSYSPSNRYSRAIELAEMAARHEIRGSGSELRHVVSFTKDQVDLMAALYSLSLPMPRDSEALKSIIAIEQKLREEGYFEFTHICSDEPIDLLNKPKSWAIKPKKKSRNYRNQAFEKVRRNIALEKYDEAMAAYYEMLGDRLYFNGQLHKELIYLKRLANIPLTGRDLLYFRSESARSELINSNLAEYCSCIDKVLEQYRKAGLKLPLDIIIENSPTMKQLIDQRKQEMHRAVYFEDGIIKRDKTSEPVTVNSLSTEYDKCPQGVLFDRFPDQVQFCRLFEDPQDPIDKHTYSVIKGTWITLSPNKYQEDIINKNFTLIMIEFFQHKSSRGKEKEINFTHANSFSEIEKTFQGSRNIHIQYTGRSHKIKNTIFYEVNLLCKTIDFPTEDLGNSFIEYVEEILREAENMLRENHGLPRIGEGWISEMQLYNLVKTIFSEAQHHVTPEWLKPQHIDVFVPSKKLAFEYQGIQHFKPIDFFGGEESFERTKKLDIRKIKKCKSNGVLLIYWRYDEPINQNVLTEKLRKYRINL